MPVLNHLQVGRPDWVDVEGMASVMYSTTGFGFTNDVTFDPVPVWPWPTVQVQVTGGVAALQVFLTFFTDSTLTAQVGSYTIDVAANGNGNTAVPAQGPFMQVRVHQAVAAVNNTVGLYFTLSMLPVTQLNDRESGSMLTRDVNVGAGATDTATTVLTWDSRQEFHFFTAAASYDLIVSTTNLGGTVRYLHKQLLGTVGTQQLTWRGLPQPVTVAFTNHDGVARALTYSLIAVPY